MLFLFGRSNKVSMFSIRAQCYAVPSPQTNILTSFLFLSKSSTGFNNSTLPPPQGVYIQILISYNFCILDIYPNSSSCYCLRAISLFWYLPSRVAWLAKPLRWSMVGCSQAVIVSCKQLYLELRIFNIDLEFLRSGGKSI